MPAVVGANDRVLYLHFSDVSVRFLGTCVFLAISVQAMYQILANSSSEPGLESWSGRQMIRWQQCSQINGSPQRLRGRKKQRSCDGSCESQNDESENVCIQHTSICICECVSEEV